MIALLNAFYKARYQRFNNRSQLLHWQAKQIKKHLGWVCQHSPYYETFQGQSLDQFPIINKQLMMKHFDQLNTRGLKQQQLFEIATEAENSRQFKQSSIGDITVGLSSGTSGQRGLFLANSQERQIWAGNILGKLLPNLLTKHRIALVLRANSPLYSTINKGPIQFCYIDITQPIAVWMKQLDQFQPTLLIGSAQALQLCALFTGQYSALPIKPTRIISGAEVLTPADKAMIQESFKCPIHEVYQCTEGFLGSTDQFGQMRWNEDIVFIEKHWLNEQKTHYSPIITDFRRRTQPIIRYQLDDVIKVSDSLNKLGSLKEPACLKGPVYLKDHEQLINGSKTVSVFEAIGAIAGRCGDCLILNTQGKQVPLLPDLIYRAISLKLTQHCDYRISQVADNKIEIAAELSMQGPIQAALVGLFTQQGLSSVEFTFALKPTWNTANKQRRVVNLCTS